MAIARAMWIHGHSVRVEYPDRMDEVKRIGDLARLKGKRDTKNWFHLAVPTTVFVDSDRLRIESVMLRFRTSEATITKVHVYDGANKIASNDGLNLSPESWAFERFTIPGEPEIRWGLGISFKGEFGFSRSRRIEISSAGGDFIR